MVCAPRSPNRYLRFPDPLTQFVQFAELSNEIGCRVSDGCKALLPCLGFDKLSVEKTGVAKGKIKRFNGL